MRRRLRLAGAEGGDQGASALVAGFDAKDHAAQRDRLQSETLLGIELGSALERAHGPRVLVIALETLAELVRPPRVLRLELAELFEQRDGLGVLAARHVPARLVPDA